MAIDIIETKTLDAPLAVKYDHKIVTEEGIIKYYNFDNNSDPPTLKLKEVFNSDVIERITKKI